MMLAIQSKFDVYKIGCSDDEFSNLKNMTMIKSSRSIT